MPDTDTPIPASQNFTKLKAKLRELFELDKADLDFGIYRVLRQRHTEIAEFLDKHLETTVRSALTEHSSIQTGHLEDELAQAMQAAKLLRKDPETFAEVLVLRERIAKGSDLEATADEVYSHLLTFFSRYYQGGDFLGLHRSTVHGQERYMIPYNGEEVKLIWANMDQYYIKSSELLRDYNFKVSKNLGEIFKADPKDVFTVQFKLIEGDTEKDNRKADSKTTRAFSLDTDTAFVETDEHTLTIQFRYREHPSERSLQDKLNADTEKTLADTLPPKWKELLFAADPSYQPKDKKDSRTVFQKHLRSYTAKHLFDYFIHKDLGGFLRRELDFYVKNEVMHLDDIEDSTAPKAEEYLSKIRAVRRCALPVIRMVAQLEEFQKKLWLKKKFVVETRYCMTLDRVPEALYADICQCEAQWQEWEELVAISEVITTKNTESTKGSGSAAVRQVGATISSAPKGRNIPAQGELGENAQALKGRPKSSVTATGSGAPSGLGDSRDAGNPGRCPGLVSDAALRLKILKAHPHLMVDTKHFDQAFTLKLLASIDDLDASLDGVCFHSENFQALQLIQERYKQQVKCVYIDPPYNTASAPILYKNDYKHSSWASLIMDRLALSLRLLSTNGVKTVAIDDTEVGDLVKILEQVAPNHRLSKITVVHNPKGSITKDFNRTHEYALFLTPEGVSDCIARSLEENDTPRKLRRWGENSRRIDRRLSFYPIYVKNGKITRVGLVPESHDFHPSGKNVPIAGGEIEIWPIDGDGVERRWNFGLDSINENLSRIIVREVDGELDLFLTHELTVPKTVWSGGDYDAGNWGNSLLIAFLGEKKFDFPKSIHLVVRCINLAVQSDMNAIVLDYFPGSGTTPHAVILLNKKDNGQRKYVVTEMGVHFEDVLVTRLKKVAYASVLGDWKEGKPQTRNTGISHAFKIVRLESYEDTLNNLRLSRSAQQETALANATETQRDAYLLGYFLDVESEGSASLLDVGQFRDPFGYKLHIATSSAGETKETNVDLVETFNWLLGLKVKHIDHQKGFLTVTGERRAGGRCLILWRSLSDDEKADNAALVQYLEKITVSPADTEYDFIYLNGPHTLNDPHNKVHLIEETFHRLMFDTTNFESLS